MKVPVQEKMPIIFETQGLKHGYFLPPLTQIRSHTHSKKLSLPPSRESEMMEETPP